MTRAQAIVDILLENDSLDSYEGVTDWDPAEMFRPGTQQHREFMLRYHPPKSKWEAKKLGVNWYIKDFRKYTFDPDEASASEPPLYPRKSHSIATGRNQRRRSFGYTDVYSTRERDWPSGGRDAFYRRQERERKWREKEDEERHRQATERSIGAGI